jgi:hypothetical protein
MFVLRLVTSRRLPGGQLRSKGAATKGVDQMKDSVTHGETFR